MPMTSPFMLSVGELTPQFTGSPMQRPYCIVILPGGNLKSVFIKEAIFFPHILLHFYDL
jgi:hypothetical protein